MSAPERYGKRNVAKMIRQVEAHRQAVRSEGTPAIQETWDKIEEHIDYAYRADLAPAAPKVRALVEAAKEAVEALDYSVSEIADLENTLSNYRQNWQPAAAALSALRAALAALEEQ